MNLKNIPQQSTNTPHLRKAIETIVTRLPDIIYTPRANREIDFYGASDCIAKQLHLKKPLFGQATWKHGWLWFDTISPIRIVESGNNKISNLVFTKKDESYLKMHGYAKALAVGAPIIYAQAGTIERIPNSILVFPPHSTSGSCFDARKDNLPYVNFIKKLKKQFPLVVASIGAADVLNGNWVKAFEKAGIPWITGAWSFDRNGLTRMQILLRSFEFATSNYPGSHFAYAAYCGCKVSFWGKDSERSTEDRLSHPFYKRNPDIAAEVKKINPPVEFKRRYPFFFVEPWNARIQVEWGQKVLGEENRKPAEEIARLFGWKIKHIGNNRWEPIDNHDYLTNNELIQEAVCQADRSNYARAFELTNILKRRCVKLPNIDFIRGQYFLHSKKTYHAQEALKEELRHFPKNDAAKKLLDKISTAHTDYKASTIGEQEFADFLNRVRPFTKLSIERARSLYSLAKQVCIEDIPGNIVECGVAAGGSTLLLALVINKYSKRPRKVYAFDTFTGMPAPGDLDTSHGVPADDTGWGTGTCSAPEEFIHSQCNKFGVLHLVETRKGLFEDTLPENREEIGEIAMLHMDADWYASTVSILDNLFNQLNPLAYIQIDDYGAWDGCRKAIDEFWQKHNFPFALKQIDKTGFWCRKPASPKYHQAQNPLTNSASGKHHDFLNPKLSLDFMDLYLIRSQILKALNNYLPQCTGTLLDIGCGEMPYKEHILQNSSVEKYIGMDFVSGKYADLKKPDMAWDGNKIPLERSSIDCAIATELFEHVPSLEKLLLEIKRVLKPEGTLFFTVPFLWPLHDMPHDEFRYTPFSLKRLLVNSGFDNIDIKAQGGWDASLAQMIGLWVKRKPMPAKIRNTYQKQLFPLYQQLIENDTPPESFTHGHMVTGLHGTARNKPANVSSKHSEYISHISSNRKPVIITNLFPKLSETFILDQITGLLDRNIDFEIWALEDPKESCIHREIRKYNLLKRTRYLKLPEHSHISDQKQWLTQFEKLNPHVNLKQVSMFHVHFGIIFNRLTPLFAANRQPVLVSFHGLDASQHIKSQGKNCYNTLFRRASMITTPSHYMKNVLINIGCPADKITVHRYGINLEYFTPGSSNRSRNGTRVLTVGRLVEKKGIEYAIKAFAQINPPDTIYRIVGEGPLNDKLIRLCQDLGIDSKVRFLGPLPKNKIISEMQKADIFMLPSITAQNGDQEGIPVTLIEAHAAGLPVVSTHHSGIPELVINGKTGLLSEEKNIEMLSANLKNLIISTDLRRKMAANARLRVQTEFNITCLNDALSAMYTRLQEQNRPDHPATDAPKNPVQNLLPNLFIIGAMKSGTTSLHYYLSLHPEISMAKEKEPHLFERHWCPENSDKWQEKLQWYASLFKEKKIRGESSTGYTMYPDRPNIPQRIHSLVPDAKLIYLVRHPVDRIISHYLHNVSRGYTQAHSVEAFLFEDKQNYPLLVSSYGLQLEQYLKYFSNSQILVVRFSDLQQHRLQTLRKIFNFLDIDPSFSHPEFQKVFNVSPIDAKRPEVSLALKNKIAAIFQEDIKKLERMTGLDFSDWYSNAGTDISAEETSCLRLAKHYIRNHKIEKGYIYFQKVLACESTVPTKRTAI